MTGRRRAGPHEEPARVAASTAGGPRVVAAFGEFGIKLRTVAVLGVMRAVSYDTLREAHESGRWCGPERLIRSGDVIAPTRTPSAARGAF